jgi:hypothetical protein
MCCFLLKNSEFSQHPFKERETYYYLPFHERFDAMESFAQHLEDV